jgi:hypothetical protein
LDRHNLANDNQLFPYNPAMPTPSNFGYFELTVRGAEREYPALIDVTSFLYDWNLLYEFSRIVVDPRYADFKFSRFSAYRGAKRIRAEDRLEVQRLRVESPIELITIVAAVPAAATTLWVMTQLFEKIVNFPLNRKLLELQRDKLRRELHAGHDNVQADLPESDATFRERLRIREADHYFNRVERHLNDSPVRVKELEITRVWKLPAKPAEVEEKDHES